MGAHQQGLPVPDVRRLPLRPGRRVPLGEHLPLDRAEGGEDLRPVPVHLELVAQALQPPGQLRPAAAAVPVLQQLPHHGHVGGVLRRGLAGVAAPHPAHHLAADEQQGRQGQHHHHGIVQENTPFHYTHPF